MTALLWYFYKEIYHYIFLLSNINGTRSLYTTFRKKIFLVFNFGVACVFLDFLPAVVTGTFAFHS